MQGKRTDTCVGLFSDITEADQAVDELMGAGFGREEISVVTREEGVPVPGGTGRKGEVVRDAAAGVTTGGAIGGITGLIIGIAAITVPGLGALFAAGPLAVALGLIEIGGTTLAGAVTGATAGGLIGGLVGLGMPKERAQEFEEAIRKGQILLAVSVTPENQSRANEIFRKHNASQVCNLEP